MRTLLRVSSYVLALLVGAALALLLRPILEGRVDNDWKNLGNERESGKYSLSLDVAMSDLPVPPITSQKGRAKFIAQEPQSTLRLGYKIDTVTGDVDRSKIPSKYLVAKPIDMGNGKTITQLPLRQINHEVHFEFVLKDKDGFKLMELQSEPHNLESSKSNLFQGVASPLIPRSIAARTNEITYKMSVDKCTACE